MTAFVQKFESRLQDETSKTYALIIILFIDTLQSRVSTSTRFDYVNFVR